MNEIDSLKDLSLEQLRLLKSHIIGEIKEKQRITRLIDKQIKYLLTTAEILHKRT